MKKYFNGSKNIYIHRFNNDDLGTLELQKNDAPRKRLCLMCGKTFSSKSAGNRRCLKCNRLILLRAGAGNTMHTEYKVALPFSDDLGQWNNVIQ
ncbi:MAG: hypothetical protein ACUZ8H_04630 [Candidatus Anammoxibacter sp.]